MRTDPTLSRFRSWLLAEATLIILSPPIKFPALVERVSTYFSLLPAPLNYSEIPNSCFDKKMFTFLAASGMM
jgi:hypothetical protein